MGTLVTITPCAGNAGAYSAGTTQKVINVADVKDVVSVAQNTPGSPAGAVDPKTGQPTSPGGSPASFTYSVVTFHDGSKLNVNEPLSAFTA